MFGRNEITSTAHLSMFKANHREPWWKLEENFPDGGMWSIPAVLDRDRFIEASAALMADPGKFADSMRTAVKKWPNSCKTALNTPGLNRRAWLGHAGCYLATGSPEETTRLGWHTLDDGEQFAANAAADLVISEWTRANEAGLAQDTLFGEDVA